MEIDEDKIDKAVLGLLQLTLHSEDRAWKGMDFEVMNRLHEKGYILKDLGLSESDKLFTELFSKK